MSSDTISSKNKTMKNLGACKIGTEEKGREELKRIGPGPQYNPPHKQNMPNTPKYTIGSRRSG
jgi:hypothetical protein